MYSSIRICVWLVFMAACFIVLNCSVIVAEPAQNQVELTLEYLKNYGYADSVSKRDGNELTAGELSGALSQLQQYAGMTDVSGQLTPETLKLMKTPRCGVPDPIGDSTGKLEHVRMKRYRLMGSRWKRNDLTYRILNYSPDLNQKTTSSVIQRAFNMWSAVSPLTFKRVYSGDADIRIRFGKYSHGDSWPFDGAGGTLAHAFGPGSNKHGINGDLDFDDSERFTDRSYNGTNLLFTAVHELGHSLGLSHSNVGEAIMYPWYPGYIKNLALQPDDIAGIHAIYGSKENPKPAVTPTTETVEYWTPPPTWSDEDAANFPWPDNPQCDIAFSAIVNINSEMFGFRGNSFWRWGVETGGKRPLLSSDVKATMMYNGIPNDIDAAYYNYRTNTLRAFKDDEYWEYTDTTPSGNTPQKICKLSDQLPAKIDAAVFSTKEDKTYMFGKQNVWRYNEKNKQVDSGYPKPIAVEFPGIGERVDTAFHGDDGESIYFVTDRVLRRVDISHHRVTAEPVFFAEQYLGCERS